MSLTPRSSKTKRKLKGPPQDAYIAPEPPPPKPQGNAAPVGRDWVDWSACKNKDKDLFFPPVDEDGVERWDVGQDYEPKRYCGVCPVVIHCRNFGLYEQYGIWGGFTAVERRSYRRRNKMPTLEDIAPRGLPRHGTHQRAATGCTCNKCMRTE
jgi:Transcription factor WhiB